MILPENKRFAVHFLMFDCQQFILRAIENCGPFVEKIYIAYSELPWAYNQEAQSSLRNTTQKDILAKSKYYEKIELIEGYWNTEEEQRNVCLKKARTDGFDYLIIQDPDEFYTWEDYRQNIDEIAQNPDFDVYRTPWFSFWKNLDHALENEEGSLITGYPQFAVSLKSGVSFVNKRNVNSDKTCLLKGLCYHLSFVLTDEEVHKKINTWGHTNDFDREEWFQSKWLHWNEATTDLHPVTPAAWRKAVKFNGKLPEVLHNFECPKTVIYNSTNVDRIKNTAQHMIYSQKSGVRMLKEKIRSRVKVMASTIIGERATKELYRSLKSHLKRLRIAFTSLPHHLRTSLTWKYKVKKLLHSHQGLQIHLGCGDTHIDGMLNCDVRATRAVDVVMDCTRLSRFSSDSVNLVFAHAVFEHYYHSQQIPFLTDCCRILKPGASLILLAIPDFYEIARTYLELPTLQESKYTFDVNWVYRYTHGNPEMAPEYWQEQLHKSIFDKQSIEALLKQAGFSIYTIFNYCYPGEFMPVNIGLVAWKGHQSKSRAEVLAPFIEYLGDPRYITIWHE